MNAKQAYNNYKLWLSWYPQDFKGAVAFASDYLDTENDVDDFQKLIEKNIKIEVVI